MRPDLRWYVGRAAAMSPAELAWRAGASVRARLPDGRVGPPARLDDTAWRSAVLDLVRTENIDLVGTAERLAAGELCFWGRRVDAPEGPDWRADPLSGEVWETAAWRGSGRDPKPLWELHRQQHLVPLASGAALAGRSDWARLVVEQALDWMERNPPGVGLGWASGYEAAHRLVTWAFALPLVAGEADEAELALLGSAVARHRTFVAARPSRFSSANNHRLAELAGLLAGSLLTPGRPDWSELWEELEREAARQTYPDGGSREQAAGYFLYVLEILWTCGVLARGAGQGLGRLEERLSAMLGWLAAIADTEGEPPAFGDDAEDRLLRLDYYEPRSAARIAARVVALLGGPAPQPAASSVLLPQSGYAVLRAGQARAVFDIGELGLGPLAAHGHADALSLVVDRGSETLLRDTGTRSYVDGREDDRATAFHNTVVVDGKSQAEALGPHLWGRRFAVRLEEASLERELDYVRASHDGYRGARHTRSVLRLGDSLLVLDRVTANRAARCDLVWQPGPALPEGPRVASHPAAAMVLHLGRWSPRYTWTEPARRLVWKAVGADVVFASAIPVAEQPLGDLRLERDGDRAVIEIAGRRIVEDWAAPLPQVSA